MRKILGVGASALLLASGLVASSAAPALAADGLPHGIGVFRPSEADFCLDTNRNGSSEHNFHFGRSEDLPIAGSWYNVLKENTAGLYRPSTATFYLNYDSDDGTAEETFSFGRTGDRPVAGDWNNDHLDDVGVFRPSTGQFLLDTNNDGTANVTRSFGQAGDLPVAGRWTYAADISGIGVFRPSEGRWYLDADLDGVSDYRPSFGTSGDLPVAGDWDGDGRDEIGVFRPSTATFYLDRHLSGGSHDYPAVRYGAAGDRPIAGIWH
ncbi:hypothetical protein AB0F81_15635 [Actinoplanes sp. NPDC024001]|uniref:hypothetical protein n=1 Tax=Actinoplanes sp. NPDC024001 TaxID=3154598 RepID=UPI0034086D2D